MERVMAGCCQFGVLPGDIDGNLGIVERKVADYAKAGCQLLVLPEMWSCGFPYPVLRAMAERTPGVLRRMQEWAGDFGITLVGSLPELDTGTVYNTSMVVDASGDVAGVYRKVHLFSLLGEHLHFGRGGSLLVCDTAAGRIGVMICYDLRFPELARRLALNGAEILCVSAQWPSPRIGHWSLLLRARAVENQLFVVGCNGSGVEGELQYGGASAIVSPLGTVLCEAGSEDAATLAYLDFDEMIAFRQHIPCLADRVPELYGLAGEKP